MTVWCSPCLQSRLVCRAATPGMPACGPVAINRISQCAIQIQQGRQTAHSLVSVTITRICTVRDSARTTNCAQSGISCNQSYVHNARFSNDSKLRTIWYQLQSIVSAQCTTQQGQKTAHSLVSVAINRICTMRFSNDGKLRTVWYQLQSIISARCTIQQ